MTRPRFHLAFPVQDLSAAREFYGGLLGCPEGRSDASWVDFDLYGHQIVAHLAPREGNVATSLVDGEPVPVRHFGVILSPEEWRMLANRLEKSGAHFRIQPDLRFQGEVGEQWTFFVDDPFGNAIEFKAFADDASVFAH